MGFRRTLSLVETMHGVVTAIKAGLVVIVILAVGGWVGSSRLAWKKTGLPEACADRRRSRHGRSAWGVTDVTAATSPCHGLNHDTGESRGSRGSNSDQIVNESCALRGLRHQSARYTGHGRLQRTNYHQQGVARRGARDRARRGSRGTTFQVKDRSEHRCPRARATRSSDKNHHFRLYSRRRYVPEVEGAARSRFQDLPSSRCSYIDRFSGEEYKGVASNYLCDLRMPGDSLTLTGPVWPRLRGPRGSWRPTLILIGSGTGIAPFRALVKHLYQQRPRLPGVRVLAASMAVGPGWICST